MSLVAYGSSSDDEDSCTNGINKGTIGSTTMQKEAESNENNKKVELDSIQKGNQNINNEISIPNPLYSLSTESIFKNLPAPKVNNLNQKEVIEEDDEFLNKKSVTKIVQTVRLPNKKGPVKITIPSLADFTDVDKELADKVQYQKSKFLHRQPKSSNLLNILPKPKSEQIFVKKSKDKTLNYTNVKAPTFIPYTVRNKRPSIITEDVEHLQTKKKEFNDNAKEMLRLNQIDSDSDGNGDDNDNSKNSKNYFSLDNYHNLPEVSTNDIQAMVAQKASQISETTTKFLNGWPSKYTNEMQIQEELAETPKEQQQLNQEAIKALVGSSAKRKSYDLESIKVTELTSEEILPNREEWLRTAVASSTGYQVTGVLVDEEPSSGTRRKHQITYLAHKAKANEAELQAIWAANRQNRRATQSKYGF